MIEPCNIRDIAKVEEVATKHFGSDATMWVRQNIYHPVNKLFYFDETLVLYMECIGTYKYSIHTIGSTRKVKDYKDFTIRVGSWMFDNTLCTCLIAFAAESNLRMQRFIGITGGKRVGIIPDAGGLENEIMYVYPIRDREQLEERLTCQQQ